MTVEVDVDEFLATIPTLSAAELNYVRGNGGVAGSGNVTWNNQTIDVSKLIFVGLSVPAPDAARGYKINNGAANPVASGAAHMYYGVGVFAENGAGDDEWFPAFDVGTERTYTKTFTFYEDAECNTSLTGEDASTIWTVIIKYV